MCERRSDMATAPEPVVKTDAQWKAELSKKEYRMLRKNGTEAPGTGEYFSFLPADGFFKCRACSTPLYSATSKFRDCGWDAFDTCFWTGDFCHVGLRREMGAYEIHCATCKSHMGHVFHGEHHTKNNERH